jgi:mannose-6-phosphate isomerase-like protein (cupin superfamily)
MKRLVLVAVVALLAGSAAQTSAAGGLSWGTAPPSLPKGAKLAVVSGDPSRAGPYVIHLRIPPAYSVPPHSHPADEQVTVISGALTIGRGTDENFGPQKVLGPGKSAVTPANMVHYMSTTQGATVQVKGQGPFQINYVNLTDDPRNGG